MSAKGGEKICLSEINKKIVEIKKKIQLSGKI